MKTFTKKIALLTTLLLVTLICRGQNLVIENFDYPGDTLPLTSWKVHNGTASVGLGDALTLAGHNGSGVGRSVLLNRANSADFNYAFEAVTSGTVYASAIVKVDENTEANAPHYFLHFMESESTSNFFARVWIHSQGTHIMLVNNSDKPSDDQIKNEGIAIPVAKGTPFFLCLKASFTEPTKVKAEIAISEAVSIEEPVFTAHSAINTAAKGIGSICLRQDKWGTSATQNAWVRVGAVRVGQTYSSMFATTPKVLMTKYYVSFLSSPSTTYHQTFMELYNAGSTDADLSGYTILFTNAPNLGAESDDRSVGKMPTGRKLIPEGTVIKAGTHLLIGGSLPTAEDSRMPSPKMDVILPGLTTLANGSIFILSPSARPIHVDSMNNPDVQSTIVNKLIYGWMKRVGAPNDTYLNRIPNQAPILSSVTNNTGDFTKILVRKQENGVYKNTGNDSLDWVKDSAALVELHNQSGLLFSLYSENFQNCIDSNLPNKYQFSETGNHDLGYYVPGWTSNKRVYWEYDESPSAAEPGTDSINVVKRGLKVGTGKNDGWFQTGKIVMDDLQRILKFQIMPFVVDDKDEYLYDMVYYRNSTIVDTVTFEIFDAMGAKWYYLYYAFDAQKNDTVSFKFFNRKSGDVVTNRFGFRNFSLPAIEVPKQSIGKLTLAEATTLDGDQVKHVDKIVRLEGVVQSDTWSFLNSDTKSWTFQSSLYDGTDYIQVSQTGIKNGVDVLPKKGDKIGISGTLTHKANTPPRLESITNYRVYTKGNTVETYTVATSIDYNKLAEPLRFENLKCLEASKPISTSAVTIKFLMGTDDTVLVTFGQAIKSIYGQGTPAKDAMFSAILGYGHVTAAGFSLIVGDTAQLIKSDPTAILPELREEVQVSLYPNPCRGQFKVDFGQEGKRELRIFNLAGMEVKRIPTQNASLQVDLSQQAKGLYFVCICRPDGAVVKTHKLVVE